MMQPAMQEANMKKQSSGHSAVEGKTVPEGVGVTMQYQCIPLNSDATKKYVLDQ